MTNESYRIDLQLSFFYLDTIWQSQLSYNRCRVCSRELCFCLHKQVTSQKFVLACMCISLHLARSGYFIDRATGQCAQRLRRHSILLWGLCLWTSACFFVVFFHGLDWATHFQLRPRYKIIKAETTSKVSANTHRLQPAHPGRWQDDQTDCCWQLVRGERLHFAQEKIKKLNLKVK